MSSSSTQLGSLPNTSGGTVVIRSYDQPLSYPNGPNYSYIHTSFGFGSWSSNSPLPPNYRYLELQDLRWSNLTTNLADFYSVSDPTILLPRNGDGLIMRNIKTLGVIPDDWIIYYEGVGGLGIDFTKTLQFIYNDDSYWTGTVRDPVNWTDDYWDEVGIDRDVIKKFLDKHPKCRI